MTNREYLIENYSEKLIEIALNFETIKIENGEPKICWKSARAAR